MDDTASLTGWSDVSGTDQVVFTVLSNADRVNAGALPRVRTHADNTPRIEELTTVPEEVEVQAPTFESRRHDHADDYHEAHAMGREVERQGVPDRTEGQVPEQQHVPGPQERQEVPEPQSPNAEKRARAPAASPSSKLTPDAKR